MGQEQRQALARLFAEDEEFRTAIMGATSADDAVRIVGEHGIVLTPEDFSAPAGGELSESELDLAAGGVLDQIWPTTPWVAC